MSDFHQVSLNIEKDDSKNNNITNKRILSKDVLIKICNYDIINNTFVQYCIEVNIISHEHFWFDRIGKKTWNVQRRFSDFVSFKEALTKRYPACVIPPLPSKVSSKIPWRVSNQINDTEFLDSRRQRLEWFLTRLISHPKLSQEHILLEFLNSEENWINNEATINQNVSDAINWRWINAQSRLIQLFESSNASLPLNDLLKSKSLSDKSLQLIERGRILHEQIENILNCLTKIEDQTVALHNLYGNYSEAFHDWCATENDSGDIMQTFGHLCENFSAILDSECTSNRQIAIAPTGTGSQLSYNALTWPDIILLLHELYDYGECWIELAGRMAALQRQMNRERDAIDDLSNQRERIKNGLSPKSGLLAQLKTKMLKAPSTSDISALTSSLEGDLVEHNKVLDSLKISQDLFECCVAEEIAYFEEAKSRDLALVKFSYADNQLTYNEQCLRLWKRAKDMIH